MKRRGGAVAVPVALLAASLLLPPAAAAADKGKANIDTDFLEFLGSIDDEGEGWSEFLESKDPVQSAPPPVAAKPPATPPPTKAPERGKGK